MRVFLVCCAVGICPPYRASIPAIRQYDLQACPTRRPPGTLRGKSAMRQPAGSFFRAAGKSGRVKVKEGREAVHWRVREIREDSGRLEVRESQGGGGRLEVREIREDSGRLEARESQGGAAGGWKSEKAREAAAGIKDGWGMSAAARGAMAAGRCLSTFREPCGGITPLFPRPDGIRGRSAVHWR